MVRDTLAATGGDIRETMAALSLPRKTFHDKMSRHGIAPRPYRGGQEGEE